MKKVTFVNIDSAHIFPIFGNLTFSHNPGVTFASWKKWQYGTILQHFHQALVPFYNPTASIAGFLLEYYFLYDIIYMKFCIIYLDYSMMSFNSWSTVIFLQHAFLMYETSQVYFFKWMLIKDIFFRTRSASYVTSFFLNT